MVISFHHNYSSVLNYLFDARAAGRKLGQGFSGVARKEFDQAMDEFFDEHLYPFANHVEYIAKAFIKKAETTAKRIIHESIEQVSTLVESLFKKAEDWLKQAENIGKSITALIKENLIQPTLQEIERLETKLFQDANDLIDRFEEVVTGQLEKLRLDIQKFRHFIPAPWDQCKQQLNIHWKSGLDLSCLEIYRLMECYELSKINEDSPIDKIYETYAQLQHSAVLMKHLAKGAPAFQNLFINDWFKYGQLCEFWHQYI